MLLLRHLRHGPCCPDGSPSHLFFPFRPVDSAESKSETYMLHKLYCLFFLSLLGQPAAEIGSQTPELVHIDTHHILLPHRACLREHYIDRDLYYTSSYPEGFVAIDQVPKCPGRDGTAMSPSVERTHRVARDSSHGLNGSTGPSFHLL